MKAGLKQKPVTPLTIKTYSTEPVHPQPGVSTVILQTEQEKTIAYLLTYQQITTLDDGQADDEQTNFMF